ncbi:Cytochrome P450 [Dillenia turbinata]|uniref:Cytochrome P450 n=1 Tax=Dillenia turbinata TaxID=194707 RepID=A0AAN8VHY3_9MAGN
MYHQGDSKIAPSCTSVASSTNIHICETRRLYCIPPKTNVLINARANQRDPIIWDMPENFQPERFRDNPLDFRGQQFEFIPFGGERRSHGISLSFTMSEYVIANLVHWFDWELLNGKDLDMSEAHGPFVQNKTPLRLVPTQLSYYAPNKVEKSPPAPWTRSTCPIPLPHPKGV